MPIMNYTTKVEPEQTAAEIQRILVKHGVRRVLLEYSPGSRDPVGLSFTVETSFGERPFALPVNVDGVERILAKGMVIPDPRSRTGVKMRANLRKQSERVAWRILKDWIKAQLAIVEMGLMNIDEVMLPYLCLKGNKTVYQHMREQQLALPAPSSD
jgi:hypothetical protein